jgi:hypothetical protein
MSQQHVTKIASIEQLISHLEHIEQSELSSDIRENVRAELKRIKRNVSAVLAFTDHPGWLKPVAEPGLREAITNVRRECLALNGTISKLLILQTIRADRWVEYSSVIMEQYVSMAEAIRQMCLLEAPLRAQELTDAL